MHLGGLKHLPQTEPRFTQPPGEETPEIRNLIDKAQVSLASGRTSPTNLLTIQNIYRCMNGRDLGN